MGTIFIFRRDLRLNDNTTLICADKENNNIIPIFIFDPHQVEAKIKSNNCIQFLVESINDLRKQLREYHSKLYVYYGKPWDIVEKLIKHSDIKNVYTNMDYTVYSKKRDGKIEKICKKYDIPFIQNEDMVLNNIHDIKTITGKHYEKFTPYYNNAKRNKVREPNIYKYKNLTTNFKTPIVEYKKYNELNQNNTKLYIHGGRINGMSILRNIVKMNEYNKKKDTPEIDTTLLSPHNKFGTVSIREVYYKVKNKLGNKNEILRQLYWRDFYYNQMYYNTDYHELSYGKYAKLKWNNNYEYYRKWKIGQTGIPIVDAGMIQLRTTGWIHNRIRMIVATVLTKVLQIDWRMGETHFKKYLVDYDITQNIMNWYWISGEAPFSNPYFRILNPINQTLSHDKECRYTEKIIENKDCHDMSKSIVDINKMIAKSKIKYT
jgi:deoxyribodipyrimidine photo-lyase